MGPVLGQAAFRLGFFIVFITGILLFFLQSGSAEQAITLFTFIIGLVFLIAVALLIRFGNYRSQTDCGCARAEPAHVGAAAVPRRLVPLGPSDRRGREHSRVATGYRGAQAVAQGGGGQNAGGLTSIA